jgi:hypothetical protein
MTSAVVLLMASACIVAPPPKPEDPRPDAGGPKVACAPPRDLAVPFNEADGTVIHWALSEGCIPTSYAPDMEAALPEFQAALKAWDDQACSDLCFTAPTLSTVPLDDLSQRRIHLISGVPPGGDGHKAKATLTFFMPGGRMVKSVIYVDPAHPATLSSGDWLAQVGKSLGLSAPDTDVDSVLTWEQPQPRTALTARDIESFCRLYGRPTYCGD